MRGQVLGLLIAAVAPACVDSVELDSEQSDIINGNVIPAEGSGMVMLNTSKGVCTGTLMTNRLVLTAKDHCVTSTDYTNPSTVSATMGSQHAVGDFVFMNPNADVAVIELATPLAMNGSFTDYQMDLYPDANSTLVAGMGLTCRGYGPNTNANTGAGTLRQAFLAIFGTNFWDFYNYDIAVEQNNQSQWMVDGGDMGGSCQILLPQTGNMAVVGVANTQAPINHNWDNLVSAQTIRAWYNTVVTPSTEAIQQWGQGSSGIIGISGDIPVPMDFDYDGITDFVVWRPLTGMWLAVDYATQVTSSVQWGQYGDVPLHGDFDHDGRQDLAVWRPSTGMWYVRLASGGSLTQQWGTQGDIPVPGDYDGDGKTDFAVWRPSSGTWFVIYSSTGTTVSRQWGTQGDIPVPGDYDNDNRTDYAVWRPSSGTWFVIDSSTGTSTSQVWGQAGDVPMTGMLKCRPPHATGVAVWRPSIGAWFIHGQSMKLLGVTGDIPVIGKYEPFYNEPADIGVWRPSNGTWYVGWHLVGC